MAERQRTALAYSTLHPHPYQYPVNPYAYYPAPLT